MRKSRDFLIFAADLLSVYDILTGIVTGQAALTLFCSFRRGGSQDDILAGAYWREILLGSLLAALLLREPKLAVAPKRLASGQLLGVIRNRGLLALTVLLAVGLSTRAVDDLACSWLVTWSGLYGLCVTIGRMAFFMLVRHLQDSGALREAVAIVSLAGSKGFVTSHVAAEADVVLNVSATKSDGDTAGCACDGGPCDGAGLEHVLALGQNGHIDSVIVTLAHGQNPDLPDVLVRLKSLPVQIVLCEDSTWTMQGDPEIRMLGGVPMTVVANRPIRAWNFVAKLLIDKVVSASCLVMFTPIMLVIALAITIASPGPIIFRQQRSGWNGRSFVLFKFRTMHVDARHVICQTYRNDPRLTSVGAFLRRSSLDELPQLINVLRGDMSLVGPRPHAEAFHNEEVVGRAIVAEYAQRYRVRPGMTGWAQVNGFRGPTMTSEQMRRRVEHDLFYIENWSLFFDVRILLLTPFAVFSGENAF
jgi:Undecaprenyl-phosphate glucose phosphotransferase